MLNNFLTRHKVLNNLFVYCEIEWKKVLIKTLF